MYSETLQGCLLKFGRYRKILCTSAENFVYCLSNNIPPWAAYCAFMSVLLIALDKHPGVHPFGVGETWRPLFSKVVIRVTGPESTRACQDDQLWDRLKVVIDVTVHGVQYIWDTKSTTEYWGFLLVGAKKIVQRDQSNHSAMDSSKCMAIRILLCF